MSQLRLAERGASLLGPPPGACIDCDQIDCTGANGKERS